MPIQVDCPRCQRQHQADESLAGTKAKCPCGQILTVPQQPVEADDTFWDELDKTPAMAAPEIALPPTRTAEEEGREQDAQLYATAIAKIQSGVSPKKVLEYVVQQGVPRDAAKELVRQIAPRGYVERADNRAAGRAQMLQGLIGLVSGIIIASLAFRVGLIVLVSVVLIVVGLFRFLAGLIKTLTGAS